jgi:bifunctional DNA-binding transcriptional regulator/antitoxin component of YhaV-PrlF toxin-antitoxin module
MNTKYFDPQTSQSLRKKFNIPRGEFAIILVGKDGGIKLNRAEHSQLNDIFALIDAMPMRQEEMRQKIRGRESNSHILSIYAR